MVKITHVLKDGTVAADLTGHIVRVQDAQTVYTIAKQMRKRKDEKQNGNV